MQIKFAKSYGCETRVNLNSPESKFKIQIEQTLEVNLDQKESYKKHIRS